MSKTIAMTGATGFTGRHAVTELLKRGHRIAALVRDPARAGLPPGVELVAGHLEDATVLATLVRGADAVVHLAGVISASTPADYFRYNAAATRALAQAAADAGVRRFLFASSLAAREPELSFYGASKLAAEHELRQFEGVLNTLMLRPPAIYGPGDRATLPLMKQLTHAIAMIPGRRGQRFSLIYAEDFARLLGDAVAGRATGTLEVSDGTPGGYGWDDLAGIARKTSGRNIRPVFLPKPLVMGVALLANGMARLSGKPSMLNPGKVRELYHPDWVVRAPGMMLADPVTFARGLPQTLAWYRAAGWLPRSRRADKSSLTSKHEAQR
ncbi:MAG: NAD-dependent epimerase/dehydratase family protein [Aestuariivirga sp.]